MDAPLPCPAGGGAEAVTPGLVTVSLGKRPMQQANTWQGTSRRREAGGYSSGPPSEGHLPTQLGCCDPQGAMSCGSRSEEHTSELQSRLHLVCRLLLEKKNKHAFIIA